MHFIPTAPVAAKGSPQMLTIYGRANSSNVRKILWLCEEIGHTDYERLDYGRGYKPCSSPEYITLNPNQVVPTLVDGDFVLWESNAQLRYLADKFKRDDLYPGAIAARAKVDMWLDWQLTTMLNGIRNLFQGLHVKDQSYTDAAFLENSLSQATAALDVLDGNLATTSAWVTGEDFSIADCAIGMFVHRWFMLPIERRDFKALKAYYGRLQERAPFRKWIIDQGI